MAKKKSSPNAVAMKHQSPKPNPFATKSPKLSRSDDNATTKETKKKKKNSKLGPKAMAMKVQPPKPNPFETIWSRRKFDVLGKKRKGEERRMGLARSQAIEKRKKTLLKEYEQSGKSSVFVDKRIGEENDELDEFDKAIRRTQRERQLKQSKKSKYNLSDGEEDEFEFQSLGALSQRDDFEDDMPPEEDEDDDGGESGKKSYQFNSADKDGDLSDGNENRHKSDKERYAEMILKSKNYKAEKSKEKDENKDLMEELDKKFTSVIASKALTNKSFSTEYMKKHEVSATQIFGTSEQEKSDSYDKLERELAMERRAQPSNRTKTPEEIAQEEREQLERLEEERQKRMHPTDDYSDEDIEDAEKPSTLRPRSISGDDLGDSFSLEEEPRTKKGWVDEILERKDASDSESEGDDSGSAEDSESPEDYGDEGSDEDDSEGERDILNKDWEQSDDDNLDMDLDDEEEDSDEHEKDDEAYQKELEPRDLKRLKRNDAVQASKSDDKSLGAKKLPANKQSSIQSDLPYLIEAPKSMEELDALLDNLSNADIALIIHRIRASNALKLAAENKKKMQVFYGLLLQYFATLANKKPLNLELLNLLVKPLMEMSMETPYFASICARERILRTRTKFCETVKNPESSCWPASKTLFLLRLWSLIFPCSDFRHVVMTPAIFLMCEYLTRCPILSGRDVAVGSFLCSLLLSITKQSRKFCPEAVTFLQTLLRAAKERKPKSTQDSEIDHLMELKAPRPLLYIHECINRIDPLNFLTIMDLPEDSLFFTSDNFRSSVLVTVIETLRGYVGIYEGFSSFPEIFLPISTLVLELSEQENMPSALTDKFKEVAELIKTKADKHCMQRQPLQMRKQKPVAIKMLNPKFEENFVKGRDYDPDRERVERKKLKKRLTQEGKGAVRELRKDNYFLQELKSRDKALMEEERAEKYGKARLFLQEQEHAMKSGQLGKGRGKRRR
ncbi:putative nucleolar protein [Rosa chinensis]|uniref:Putative nucleolar protein n=1 Tax=Rosa chinensis TaxID=74649 RepID=A0A2P6R2D9_ROSCH|nr:nucleolar protein 14 isoform X2 [Rosa chinensis]PRQ40602.1 putative nucleolar protein [Rosa chinensis]